MTVADLSVVLLHEGMLNKQGQKVVTSLTLNDIQDIARCARTFGASTLYIAHPSPTLKKLARKLQHHWEQGYGSTYNPKRKSALQTVEVVSNLDDAIMKIDMRTGRQPTLVATSAQTGPERVSFDTFRNEHLPTGDPYLLMLGTGWGMAPELMERAEIVLEPIRGVGEFNHLSVRSAAAIMLDRLLAPLP